MEELNKIRNEDERLSHNNSKDEHSLWPNVKRNKIHYVTSHMSTVVSQVASSQAILLFSLFE